MARPEFDGVARRVKISVRMSETDAHTAMCGFSDQLGRAVEFWRDGENLDIAARGLPQPVERGKRGRQ